MCISAATMMAISAGVSVVGGLANGMAQRDAANQQARIAENMAAQQRDAAQAEAERIRSAGKRAQGAARAQMAASGIAVNEGSAVTIEQDIGTRSEQDAYNILLTGDRQARASEFDAAQARSRGRNALTSSVLGAVSTGLQGWKGVKAAQPAQFDPIGSFMRGTRGSGD